MTLKVCEQLPTINVVEHNVKLCVVLEGIVQVHDKRDLGRDIDNLSGGGERFLFKT